VQRFGIKPDKSEILRLAKASAITDHSNFIASNKLSFGMYQKFASFEKTSHNVDIGNSYLSEKDGRSMVMYLSATILEERVTRPLNEGRKHYFSLMYDGSSSAKTNDEKEVYVIKTCFKGEPQFDVLALEEPADVSADGLLASLVNAIEKAKFAFHRREREVNVFNK